MLKPHFLTKSPQIENEVSILIGLGDINLFNQISYHIMFKNPFCRKKMSEKKENFDLFLRLILITKADFYTPTAEGRSKTKKILKVHDLTII